MIYRTGTLASLLAVALLGHVARGQDVSDSSAQIMGKMQVAVGQLKKLDTGKPTQGTQKQIVTNPRRADRAARTRVRGLPRARWGKSA